MPIHLHCGKCGQLLKAPDEAVGKRVRCPSCEAINRIPSATESVNPTTTSSGNASAVPPSQSTPPPSPPPTEGSLTSPPAGPPPIHIDPNPFASPIADARFGRGQPADGQSQSIEFTDVMEQTWRRLRANLGACLRFSLILVGAGIVLAIVSGLVGAIAEESAVGAVLVMPAFLGFWVLGAYLQCLSGKFALQTAREEGASLRGIWGWEGVISIVLFYLFVCLLSFAAFVAIWLPILVGAIIDPQPGGGAITVVGFVVSGLLGMAFLVASIYLAIRWLLVPCVLLDRHVGIFEAMRESHRLVQGNAFSIWWLMAVTLVGSALLGTATCGLGYLVSVPFFLVMQAIIYLKTSGQYQHLPA